MKKIIRLTESDLINLVNRVTNEQTESQSQPVKLNQDLNNKMLRKFIMDFQKTNGLMVDGIVNSQTYQLMLKQGYFS
jgi:peptidoglycan hydrolase-like protein with peptidoglycan-binding domain